MEGPSDTIQITSLLTRMRDGDHVAAAELFAIFYEDIRRLAGYQLLGFSKDSLLQRTALTNEVAIKLIESTPAAAQKNAGNPLRLQTTQDFIRIACCMMRFILIDRARGKNTAKRRHESIELDEAIATADSYPMFSLIDALKTLENEDATSRQIFDLIVFQSFSEEEVCDALNLTLSDVRQRWNFLRAWLRRELTRAGVEWSTAS